MPKYGMVMDATKCNGCYNCFLACRDEFCGNDFPPYSLAQPMTGHFWMKMVEKERGQYPKVKVSYTAIPCMHCENATCLKMAQNEAVYKRADGIVIIDPVKAAGQKETIGHCPYRVIYWNEEKNIPQKCTMCAHLLDQGWKEPRCVEACPTGALIFGDLDNPKSEISKLIASGKTEPLHEEYGLQDKVRYIGLPKRFIAGTVVFGDTDECAEAVKVTLNAGREQMTTMTNNFGDFEFEGLEMAKEFSVKVQHDGYNSYISKIKTIKDTYLGEIILKKI